MFKTLALLCVSNIFMTYAWYGHLKDFRNKPLIAVIFLSWGVAFMEYCFQVPANRIGSQVMTLSQLKIMQEILALSVFAVFAVFYMKVPLTRNFLYAALCILGAAFFSYRDTPVAPEIPVQTPPNK
ncbi:MAG: DMT family protein [Bdellovibrionota bacterium]